MSKWFCDTSTSTATGAVCCGSFIEGGFDLLIVSYGWTQWTRRFTWFRLLKRNTLRQWKNEVVLLKSALPEPTFFVRPEKWRLPEPFIAQGRTVTISPEARQVAPRWLKLYTAARVLMTRSRRLTSPKSDQLTFFSLIYTSSGRDIKKRSVDTLPDLVEVCAQQRYQRRKHR
jgi:hypothetical protein